MHACGHMVTYAEPSSICAAGCVCHRFLISLLFSHSSCCLCIAMCGSSDNWELPCRLGAQRSRTNMLPTQWRLHAAAFCDHLWHRMCLCRCLVVLSCSHCDIVNQMLQIRRIGYRSAVALSSPMLQMTANVPVSDVRHHYRYDTSHLFSVLHAVCIVCICAHVWCGCVQYEGDECWRHFESTSLTRPRPQGLLLLMLFSACCWLMSNVSLTAIYQYVTFQWKFCES